MKDLFILTVSLDCGGIEKVMQNLSDKFSEKYNVKIISIWGITNKFELNHNVIYLNEKKYKNKILAIILIYLKFLKISRNKKIISFGDMANVFNLLRLAKEKDKILTVHSIKSVENYKMGLLGKIYNFFIRYFYNFSKKIIVVSKSSKEDLHSKYFLSKDKLIQIDNPYNIKSIIEKSNDETTFKVNQNFFNIITVARLNKNKGIDRALKIISQSKMKKTIKYYIIGEGLDRIRLERLVKKYRLENQVVFLGYQKNPYKYIKQMNLKLLLSEFEGFPGVLVESLACSVPILSTESTSEIRKILDVRNNTFIGKYGVVVEKISLDFEEGLPLNIEEKNTLAYLENIIEKKIKFDQDSSKYVFKFDSENISKQYIKVIEI